MVKWKYWGVIPARDRKLVDKFYQCLVRECKYPLYAVRILKLVRRRVISERNAGRYGGR
ncbi:hypothetical protein ES703_103449 [subsurface metagenome]